MDVLRFGNFVDVYWSCRPQDDRTSIHQCSSTVNTPKSRQLAIYPRRQGKALRRVRRYGICDNPLGLVINSYKLFPAGRRRSLPRGRLLVRNPRPRRAVAVIASGAPLNCTRSSPCCSRVCCSFRCGSWCSRIPSRWGCRDRRCGSSGPLFRRRSLSPAPAPPPAPAHLHRVPARELRSRTRASTRFGRPPLSHILPHPPLVNTRPKAPLPAPKARCTPRLSSPSVTLRP